MDPELQRIIEGLALMVGAIIVLMACLTIAARSKDIHRWMVFRFSKEYEAYRVRLDVLVEYPEEVLDTMVREANNERARERIRAAKRIRRINESWNRAIERPLKEDERPPLPYP